MRVLVTGHKGYIGSVTVPMLRQAGHEVLGIDSDLYKSSVYYPPACGANKELIKDIRDIERDDLAGVDAIVHLAALSNDVLGDMNPDITYDINFNASVRLAELAKDAGVQRFVFASSCSMYGASDQGIGDGIPILDEQAQFNPVTAYATSKVLVERDVSMLADTGFSPTFMRNATAYGMSPKIRFDLVVNNLVAWAYTTGKVMMKSDGSPWRPLVHIEDISTAVIAVLASEREQVHNEAFNIGRNEENYQIRAVAETVRDIVPDCELTFAAGAEPDLRNYRVAFDKYERVFQDYPLKWTVRAGVESILDKYRKVGLSEDDYEGPQFKRIGQLKKLMSENRLNDSMRWV